ncbi:MAG: 16S rRNA (cytidine(1402)-2'-O)-methyltransferase [Leptolyngbya sp. SIO4C5]|nr:16S rRNA (cytidine(1402)-2'-O)-methyltransferase [Leptolyngbya sp. SIO4C5]
MTLRAVRVLGEADLIAAEDTRHTGKLLQHFQIKTPQLSYHEHNQQQRIPEILRLLQQGKTVALVSDAGMPGISDPGYELVKACRAANLPVIPIPGVTAAITAIAASGLPTDRFTFEGFLPAKGKARRDRLQAIQSEPCTLIFYEAPHRLEKTLADLADTLGGDRLITTARELTKRYEEFWQGTLTEAIAHYQITSPKGEFTLVVAGAPADDLLLTSPAEIRAALAALMKQGLSRSQASRQVAPQTNLSRQQVYKLAIAPETE